MRRLWLACLFCVAALPSFAEENPLLGTWRLQSFVREVKGSGERYDQLGAHPFGYLTYSPDGRMVVLFVDADIPELKSDLPTDAERVRMHSGMISYAGTYVVEPDKVTHHIDVAWNHARIGQDQVRFYKIDGDLLTLTTAPNKSPVDGREGIGILQFRKVSPPR